MKTYRNEGLQIDIGKRAISNKSKGGFDNGEPSSGQKCQNNAVGIGLSDLVLGFSGELVTRGAMAQGTERWFGNIFNIGEALQSMREDGHSAAGDNCLLVEGVVAR